MWRRNFLWKLSSLILGGGVFFGFNLLLMRLLGPIEFGRWSFALGWAGLFATLVDFGFNPLAARLVAENPASGAAPFHQVCSAKALLSAAALALLLVISRAQPQAWSEVGLITGALLYLTAASFVETGQAFLQAYEWLSLGAVLSAGFKFVVALAGIGALVKAVRSPENVMASVAGAGVAGAGVATWILGRKLTHPGRLQRLPWLPDRALWKDAVPLFIQNLFILVYFRIDTVMLTALRGSYETGLYSAAYRFFELSNVIPTALLAGQVARLAARVVDRSWPKEVGRALPVYVGAAAAGWGVLFLLAIALPGPLLGSAYTQSRTVLQILALTLVFFFPNYLLTSTLALLRSGTANAVIALAGVVFNVSVNFAAIPRWGALGAAWATLGTEALISLGSGWWLWRLSRARRAPVTPAS